MKANTILVIAYGNSLRRDDGAGLVLGRQLASAWQANDIALTFLETHQLTPELALEIAQPNVATVLFVDTRDADYHEDDHKGLESGWLVPVVIDETVSPGLGHQLNPTALCLYAHNLYHHRPPAWLVTVPGWDFDHGEGLSHRAQIAVAEAFHLVNSRLAAFIPH